MISKVTKDIPLGHMHYVCFVGRVIEVHSKDEKYDHAKVNGFLSVSAHTVLVLLMT